MQVAVKVCIEPKPGTHGPILRRGCRKRAAPEDPTRSALFNRSIQQWITRKSAPRLQLGSNVLIVTNHRNEIARLTAAQNSDQLRQEARPESFMPNVQIDVSLHSMLHSTAPERPREAPRVWVAPPLYLASIQAFEPFSLTATFVKKRCRGLPSAVPRCSVEMRMGPAFL